MRVHHEGCQRTATHQPNPSTVQPAQLLAVCPWPYKSSACIRMFRTDFSWSSETSRKEKKQKKNLSFPPTHLWNLIREALSQSALKTYSLLQPSKETRILLPSPSTLWSLSEHRAKPDLWDLFLLHSKVQHFKTTGGKDGFFLSCVTWPPLQCSPPPCSSLCPRGLHSSACLAAAASRALIPTSALLFLDAPPAATQIPS